LYYCLQAHAVNLLAQVVVTCTTGLRPPIKFAAGAKNTHTLAASQLWKIDSTGIQYSTLKEEDIEL